MGEVVAGADEADAAGTGNGDGEGSEGDGAHGGADDERRRGPGVGGADGGHSSEWVGGWRGYGAWPKGGERSKENQRGLRTSKSS